MLLSATRIMSLKVKRIAFISLYAILEAHVGTLQPHLSKQFSKFKEFFGTESV